MYLGGVGAYVLVNDMFYLEDQGTVPSIFVRRTLWEPILLPRQGCLIERRLIGASPSNLSGPTIR